MTRSVARRSLVAGSIALALGMCLPAVAQGAAGTGGHPARAVGGAACPLPSAPAAPTGLELKVTATRTITATWNKSTDPNFAHYQLWRNDSADTSREDWMPMAGFPTSPEYKDVVPEAPKTYYYYVLAFNTCGQSSPKSLVVSRRVDAPTILTGLSASVSGGTVTLAWNRSPDRDFVEYRVWRDIQPDVNTKTWTRVGRITDRNTPTATDTPGVGRFYYHVTQHSSTNFSDESSPVEVFIAPPPDPDKDKDGANAQGFPGGNDCDDNNAAVRPGRADITNGIDDDCDGVIDPNGPQDRDSDGVNASPFGDDCNDANAAVRPGVRDVTNAIDDDCDGIIDPDVDGDGFVRGPQQDCNDADPAIRPGVLEVRGNRVDENCDGRAEPLPRIDTRVQVSSVRGPTTRVVGVRVFDLPANAQIAVTCKGGGCPRSFTQRLTKPRKVHSLSRRFRQVRLRPGAVLEVRITAAGLQGRRWRFEARRDRPVRSTSSFIGDGFR